MLNQIRQGKLCRSPWLTRARVEAPKKPTEISMRTAFYRILSRLFILSFNSG